MNSNTNNIFFNTNLINEVERLCSQENQQKISEILDSRIFTYSLDKAVFNLDISNLFIDFYWKTLGFTDAYDALKEIDIYHETLEFALNKCKDNITPLLIQSIKCHLKARFHFDENNQEGVVSAMAETGEIAKELVKEYKNLNNQFSLIYERQTKISLTLYGEEFKLIRKSKEHNYNEISINNCINRNISNFSDAIAILHEMRACSSNVYRFWSSTKYFCKKLANPKLGNISEFNEIKELSLIKEDYESKKHSKEFINIMGIVENEYRKIDLEKSKISNKEITFHEVAKSMKTGYETSYSITPITNLLKELINEDNSIEESLDHSYLKWLALVKINQTMIATLGDAIYFLNIMRNEIVINEKDCLVRALQDNK